MITAGEKLKAARLEKGLSLDDVSSKTKIKVSFLEYIEKGEYQKLPSVSYAHGFVRNFAIFLGLNEKEIMALFRREFNYEKQVKVLPKGFERQGEFPAKRLRIRSISVLVIIALVLFLGFILFQYRSAFFNPTLSLISPKDNAVINSSQIKIEGKTDSDATVYVDKNEVSVDTNGYFFKILNVFPGISTISITSVNKFQRQTEKKININVKGT